jgi:PPM family protein phosphatase
MPVKAHLRFAAVTDPGKRRKNNEDRYYVDPDRGIYVVIDGVGGHAAGETAAGVAVDVIRERLERESGTPEERIREAITLANNEILRLSRARSEWQGMACVLTLALVEEDIVTVGHVGDSRLYLIRRGEITKITHDHSPVGEREDRGELNETEAMRHSRRNEIYRDVGSAERNPDDPAFIELQTFPMPSDGVLLLCSDGLTDLVTSAEVRAGIERYAPDFDAAARALIAAANDAGGKDNITVVIVAGGDFGEAPIPVHDTVTSQHPTMPPSSFAFLLLGLLMGLAMGVAGSLLWNRMMESGPRNIRVGSDGIAVAIAKAHAGDTVVIPEGGYREHIELRQNVTVRAEKPGTVAVTSPDRRAAVRAKGMYAGGIEGVWIQGDTDAPLSTGIEIDNASPTISNVKITGAGTGIEIRGASTPVITASQITNNLGTGILILSGASPHLEGNLIAANGGAAAGGGNTGSVKPGIEILAKAKPVLKNNAIVDNAAQAIWIHGSAELFPALEENFFGGLEPNEAIYVVEKAKVVEAKKPAELKKPAEAKKKGPEHP